MQSRIGDTLLITFGRIFYCVAYVVIGFMFLGALLVGDSTSGSDTVTAIIGMTIFVSPLLILGYFMASVGKRRRKNYSYTVQPNVNMQQSTNMQQNESTVTTTTSTSSVTYSGGELDEEGRRIMEDVMGAMEEAFGEGVTSGITSNHVTQPQGPRSITCPGCGATNEIQGATGSCEYCGATIS